MSANLKQQLEQADREIVTLAARVAELEAALRLAEAYVGKGVADGTFNGCAMSGERALEKISAALMGKT